MTLGACMRRSFYIAVCLSAVLQHLPAAPFNVQPSLQPSRVFPPSTINTVAECFELCSFLVHGQMSILALAFTAFAFQLHDPWQSASTFFCLPFQQSLLRYAATAVTWAAGCTKFPAIDTCVAVEIPVVPHCLGRPRLEPLCEDVIPAQRRTAEQQRGGRWGPLEVKIRPPNRKRAARCAARQCRRHNVRAGDRCGALCAHVAVLPGSTAPGLSSSSTYPSLAYSCRAAVLPWNTVSMSRATPLRRPTSSSSCSRNLPSPLPCGPGGAGARAHVCGVVRVQRAGGGMWAEQQAMV